MAVTDINFTSAAEGASQWKSANDYLSSNCSGKFSSSFSKLYVATGYIQEIENSIKEMLDISIGQQANFLSLVEELSGAAEEHIPDDPYSGHDGGGSGGETPFTPPTPVPPEDDHGKEINHEPLTHMKLSELNNFGIELIALAKQHKLYLDQLLLEDKYVKEIKKLILESPNIPQEFKDIIADSSIIEVKEFLYDLLSGKYPDIFALNELNISTIFEYINAEAEAQNIPVEELLMEEKNHDKLRTILNGLGNASQVFAGWEDLPDEEVQNNVLNMYTGDADESTPKECMNVTRTLVDNITEQVDIGYEDLLTDSVYAESVKEAVLQLGKAAEFFNLNSFCTNKVMSENTISVLTGNNVAGGQV